MFLVSARTPPVDSILCCFFLHAKRTRGVPRERFACAKKNEDRLFLMRFFSTHESITHANMYANGEQNANKDAKITVIHGFCASVRVMNPMGFSMVSAISLRRSRHSLNSWSPNQNALLKTDVSANNSQQERTVQGTEQQT